MLRDALASPATCPSVCPTCSRYQVVVEEERPRRQKRGSAEILRCYPVPIHFQNASLLDSHYYFSAELPMSDLKAPLPFCVGQWPTHMHTQKKHTQLNTSVCVADPLCVCVKQVTTGPTAATGTPPCCPIKATASTTRLSAQPMG